MNPAFAEAPAPFAFLGIDEGRQRLYRFEGGLTGPLWELDLAGYPQARALQRVGPDRALVGYDRGFLELDIRTGELVDAQDRWRDVTSATRFPDGRTLLAGLDLDGRGGVTLLELDAHGAVTREARREGDYVRLTRPTQQGTWLVCMDDRVLETDGELRELRRFGAEGFKHAWSAHRFADGSTLISAGYGAFMARFDAAGRLSLVFGAAGQVPQEASPFFYAAFDVLADGRIAVANWQGHGPGNGSKGRQLIVFAPDGQYLASWSDAGRISSLQGLLILPEGGDGAGTAIPSEGADLPDRRRGTHED